MQLILVGDFFQLPPVDISAEPLLKNEELYETGHCKVGSGGFFAFQSHSWSKSNLHIVELVKIHRQACNDGLLEFLNDMRIGDMHNLEYKHEATISALLAPLPPRDDGIIPTELHSRNDIVASTNSNALRKLSGESHLLKANDEVVFDRKYKEKVLKKFNLNEYSHMPYLWAPVEKQKPSPELRDAQCELETLEKRKCDLIKDERYEELIPLRDKMKDMKEKTLAIAIEEAEKKDLTHETIYRWLLSMTGDKSNVTENTQSMSKEDIELRSKASSISFYVKRFQEQLKKDYDSLCNHAQKRFFADNCCRVNNEIELKANANMMLLWNLDVRNKLANGSRGVILALIGANDYQCLLEQELTEREERYEATKGNKLALNESNKSEIMAQDKMNESINKNANAQEESAKLHDPVILEELKNHIAMMGSEMIKRELTCIEKGALSKVTQLPYVKFTEGQKRLIVPQPFRKEFKGVGTATRWQVPLTLGYAITIHKSQSLTIDLLRVNLQNCFSNGQAYVACSRGRGVDSMVLENFNLREIKTSKEAKDFYNSLKHNIISYPMWSDHLKESDGSRRFQRELEHEMKRMHSNVTCNLCGSPCYVNMIKHNRGGNLGKWYVQCKSQYKDGHTWKFVLPSNKFRSCNS